MLECLQNVIVISTSHSNIYFTNFSLRIVVHQLLLGLAYTAVSHQENYSFAGKKFKSDFSVAKTHLSPKWNKFSPTAQQLTEGMCRCSCTFWWLQWPFSNWCLLRVHFALHRYSYYSRPTQSHPE